MVAQAHVFRLDTERKQKVLAIILPIVEPFQIGIRLAEKFTLHLFELADTENKVSGRYLVSEGFSDLTYAERKLLSGCALNV